MDIEHLISKIEYGADLSQGEVEKLIKTKKIHVEYSFNINYIPYLLFTTFKKINFSNAFLYKFENGIWVKV